MLVGSIIFSILNYGIDLLFASYSSPLNNYFGPSFLQMSVTTILYFLLLLLPLFFGSAYGPWVSLVILVASAYLTDSLTHVTATWNWYAGDAIIGFIAGLALIKTKGNYTTRRSRFTASFICALGLIADFGFYTISIIAVFHYSAYDAWSIFFSNEIPTATWTLLLLPILLTLYNRWVSRSRKA